jgi:hypothetical protein
MEDNDLRQGYIRLSNTSSCALDYYFRAAMASGASLKKIWRREFADHSTHLSASAISRE